MEEIHEIKVKFKDKSIQEHPIELTMDIQPTWKRFWDSTNNSPDEVQKARLGLYQAISDHIINIPYVDDKAKGHQISPPKGPTIYRPNHDTAHGLRKVCKIDFLLDAVKKVGLPNIKDAASALTPEELEAVRLAGLVFRAGRSNEVGSKTDPTYAERSSLIFKTIATALGFNEALINNIAFCISNYAPITNESLSENIPYDGYEGDESLQKAKSLLIKGALDVSHHCDLVRCWEDRNKLHKDNLENLPGLFPAEMTENLNAILLDHSRAYCSKTGTMYSHHDDTGVYQVPPIERKSLAVTNVDKSLDALKSIDKDFIDAITKNKIDLDQASQTLKKIEREYKTETAEDQSDREFMIERAYKTTEDAIGINPKNVSAKSLDRVTQELKDGVGLSEKDKKSLDSKQFSLHPDEFKLFNYLINNFQWTLKHITAHLPLIQRNGNALKSLTQRNRESTYNDHRYTTDFEGRSDHVFFTIASPNGRPADFLQMAKGHEIRINLRDFLDEENAPKGKLGGLWVSNEWYSYNVNRRFASQVGNIKRKIAYVKGDKNTLFLNPKEDQLQYSYIDSDGNKIERAVKLGEETSVGKDILPFLALNTILELRHCDPSFRKSCLEKPDSKKLEAFVDLVFEQHHFEALIPAKLSLNDERIEIKPFNHNPKDTPENVDRMRNAIAGRGLFCGSFDEINTLIEEGIPIDIDLGNGLTPLAFVLNNCSSDSMNRQSLAIELINKGANTQISVSGHTIMSLAVTKQAHLVVKTLLETGVIDERSPGIKRYIDIQNEISAIVAAILNQDHLMLDIFAEHGLDINKLDHRILIALAKTPEELGATYMLDYLKKHKFDFSKNDQNNQHYAYTALEYCIKNGKTELLKKLLDSGVDPNVKHRETDLTLLDSAMEVGDLNAIKLLESHGAQSSAEHKKENRYQVHVVIKNENNQLLVFKKRQKDSSLSNKWQSLCFTPSPNHIEENLKRLIFSTTGIRIGDCKIEQLAAKEQHQLYVIELDSETATQAKNTELYAEPQWISANDIIPIDILSRAVLDNNEEKCLTAISNQDKLYQAIRDDDANLVLTLLEEGVSDETEEALRLALDRPLSNIQIVNALLDHGYDVNNVFNYQSMQEFSPLLLAIAQNNKALVEFLIEHGANPNQPCGMIKMTPLMAAAAANNVDLLKCLEVNGADYNHPYNKGTLAYACLNYCNNDTFNYLLSKADHDGELHGLTPFLVVCEQKNANRAKALLEKGIDVTKEHPTRKVDGFRLLDDHNLDKKYSPNYNDQRPSKKLFSKPEGFYHYSGADKRNNIEEEIAREYHLTFIDDLENDNLNALFKNILDQCQDIKEGLSPRFAIAHEGNRPIFTCEGFKQPVIAIHKDFLLDKTTNFKDVLAGVAHEIEYINDQYPFSDTELEQKTRYDQKVLKVVNIDNLIHYLRKAAKFYTEHKSNRHFTWPDTLYSQSFPFFTPYYEERIKPLKITAAENSSHHRIPLKESFLPIEDIKNTEAFDYFPDFPKNGSTEDQWKYIKGKLPDLQQQLLPFQIYYLPSQRLKQFCRLLSVCDFDDDKLDEIARSAHDLKLPGFAFLYKVITKELDPMERYIQYKRRRKEILLPALGYFREMLDAVSQFISVVTTSTGTNIEAILTLANHILDLYPKMAEHLNAGFNDSTGKNLDFINYYFEENQTLPDTLPLISAIARFIDWPELKLNDYALKNAKDDKTGIIAHVLWILGGCEDKRIYDVLPEQFIEKLTSVDHHHKRKFEALNNKTMPITSLDFHYDYQYLELKELQLESVRKKEPDFSMLKGNFMDEFDAFMQANYVYLISSKNRFHSRVTKKLLEQLSKLAKGNIREKQFVRSFFMSKKPFCFNTFIWELRRELHKLKKRATHYYSEFAIEHQEFLGTTLAQDIFLREYEFSKNVGSIDLAKLGIDKATRDPWYKIILGCQFINDSNRKADYISHYLEELKNTDGLHSNAPKTMMLLEYLRQHDTYELLSTQLMSQLTHDNLNFEQLSAKQCILLYRLLDRHFTFPNEEMKTALRDTIMNKIKYCNDLTTQNTLLEQLIFVKDSPCSTALHDINLTNTVITMLAENYATMYGKDDGSHLYYSKIMTLINNCYSKMTKVHGIKLFDRLTQLIESQQKVSRAIGLLVDPQLRNERFDHADNQSTWVKQYTMLARFLSACSKGQERKDKTLDFISSELTKESLNTYSEFVLNNPELRHILIENCDVEDDAELRKATKQALIHIHQQFWDLSLEQRAIAIDSLIVTAKEEQTEESFEKAYNLGFDYISKKIFPNIENDDDEDAFAFSLLKAYLETADNIERQFLLAGLIIANKETDEHTSVGKKFAILCEHMGPAYIKLAQAIHSHPDTPEHIKKDLEHVKGHANPPYRWNLWHLLENTVPKDEFHKIKRLGKILGSASYNIAVECEYADDPNLVMTLLRNNAERDAQKGFDHIRRTIEACDHQLIKQYRESFIDMIDEAENMSHNEIDNDVADKQFKIAHEIYDHTCIEIQDQDDPEPYLVNLKACNKLRSGPGYKVITKMPGPEFNDLPDDTNEQRVIKKVIAKAVMQKELTILLSGKQFDSDRHGSQLRVEIDDHTINLGLYDFGEMNLEPLSETELETLAQLVKELPSTSDIQQLFQSHINKANDEGMACQHLIRINKALLALGDFKKYLSDEEIKDIIMKIGPDIHPTLNSALIQGAWDSMPFYELGFLAGKTIVSKVTNYLSNLIYWQPESRPVHQLSKLINDNHDAEHDKRPEKGKEEEDENLTNYSMQYRIQDPS